MDIGCADSIRVLDQFHPAVSSWFRETVRGTDAASTARLARDRGRAEHPDRGTDRFREDTRRVLGGSRPSLADTPKEKPGVRILYVSPLKALNQDVWRNLQVPLEGILAKSEAMGDRLPTLNVAVRSGDTPSQERARLVRKPPDILITTPESLHLMLTSRARAVLRGITHVIVDEIHAVCGNKRGVFLALLLERLEANNPSSFVRIGLSATQRRWKRLPAISEG